MPGKAMELEVRVGNETVCGEAGRERLQRQREVN